MNDYNFISLGSYCLAASLIKGLGLRKASYPFDWVFSSPQAIEDGFGNDFKLFLDPSYYIPHELEPETKSGHRLFDLKFFNHHDPKRKSEDYEHYQRAVERFREVKNDPKTIYVCVDTEMREKFLPKEPTYGSRIRSILDRNGVKNKLLTIVFRYTGQTTITEDHDYLYITLDKPLISNMTFQDPETRRQVLEACRKFFSSHISI